MTKSALALLLLIGVALPAQDAASQEKGSEFSTMVAEWRRVKASYRAATARVRDSEAYREARAVRDLPKMRALVGEVKRPDALAYGARAMALADGREAALRMPVLVFAATELGNEETARLVIARIARDHLESEQISALLKRARSFRRLIGHEESEAFFLQVVAKNPHPLARAYALAELAGAALRNGKASSEDLGRARERALSAAKLAEGTELEARAQGLRFEVLNMLPGCKAPEIKGEDMEGIAFQLSDYRGQVVLLNFWAFW